MNPRTLLTSLACLAILLAPAIARASADLTPPALVSLSFAPGSIDVSSSSQIIAITAEATDDSSGVEAISGYFRSPSGRQTVAFSMGYTQPESGTPLDAVYSTTVTFSTCAEQGTWTLESVEVTDECENATLYAPTASGSTLAFPAPDGVPIPTTINVTNSNPDLMTPQVTTFTYNPMSVDLTSTNMTVTVMITGSDISDGYFTFVSPSGKQTKTGGFDSSDLAAGVYTTTVTFDTACDEAGNWKLEYISADDGCGNSVLYGSSGLPFPTDTTVLSVTNPSPDVTAPMLESVELSATMADVTNGPVSVTGTAVATDNISGVQSGSGYYASADGTHSISLNFYVSGNTPELSGTYTTYLNVSSCDEPGIYTLKNFVVYDQCENFKQYGGANAAFPGPTSFLIVNGTLSTGSLEVYIAPQVAEYAGTWNVDGGNTEYSGFPVTGLAPGPHVVNFLDAFGYTTPAPQNVTVVANQTTYTTGTYIAQTPTDSVQVTLVPAVTGSEGGLWNVDDGTMQSSGATVSGLSDGSHTIQFTDVSGFTTPDPQTVTTGSGLTTVTSGTYTAITQTGSLTVTIDPAGARANGARWNVDGGPSQSSGNTVNGIGVGDHFVNFTAATSYTAPLSEAVVIGASELTSTNGTYTVLASSTGALTVNITPSGAVKAGAEWNLDGGPSQASGTTLTGLSGAGHVVNFTMANGYITPASQPIDLVPNGTVVLTEGYAIAPGFSGAAESFVGISQSGYALLTLALADTGKFTGKLLVEGSSTYSLAGSFNSTGYFAGQTGKPPMPYVLQVSGSTPGTYLLTGSAQGHQITAYPAAYAKGQTVAEIGTYTALFTGTDPSAAIPRGTGYGTLKVSKTGAGSITGKLADGTSYSASSVLVAGTGGKELIIFDPNVYSKKGLLSGVFNFGVPAAGQLEGTLLWEKPDLGKGSYYPMGFVTALGATGALYDKAIPLPFTSGTVTLTGGGLATTGTAPFTVTGAGVVKIAKPDKLTIKTSTGAVSGALEPAGAAKAISFNGLLLQDGANTRAGGYFLGPVVSGSGTSGNVTLP